MALPARIVVEFEPFNETDMTYDKIKSYLLSSEAEALSHGDLEKEVESQTRELARVLLQAHLDQRGDGKVGEPVYDAAGKARSETRAHQRTLKSIFGPVKVTRTGYGGVGLKSLHPLDAELNLPPELYSHEVRRRASLEATRGSFDEAVASLSRQIGAKVAKRQLEELVVRAANDFDSYYEQRSNEAESKSIDGSLLVLSFDGKGVPMLPKDLREATRKAAQKRGRKLENRLTKGEKRHSKRMATVATVYTIAPHVRDPAQVAGGLAPIHEVEKTKPPKPECKRVWASLEKSPREVIEQAFEEAHHRDPTREKQWVALVDGNAHQLAILPEMAKKYDVDLTIGMDVIHVTEYLWKASTAFHDEKSREREKWVGDRLLKILRGESSQVAGGIRRSATLRGLDEKDRQAVDSCCDYLINHAAYLRYDQYLSLGMPIATGVIEGACRHLVKDRMELTGARWGLKGAEAVLRLRALRVSDDFDDYWKFHEAQEYERNHASQYAGDRVPKTEKSRPQGQRPALKLVK